MLNGFGRIIYGSGHYYIGELKNTKRHGTGKMVYYNGNVKDGEW